MDKNILRALIPTLKLDTPVTLTFMGGSGGVKPRAIPSATRNVGKSGPHRLIEFYRGRGKGGSWQAIFMNLDTGDLVEIGTPHSDEILSIVIGDVRYGVASEAEAPRNYAKDKVIAIQLKKALVPLLTAESGETRIRIGSSEPALNGEFTVVKAALNSGRFGQVSLCLRRDDGTEVELWSYRHSGVISSLDILTEE